MSYSSQPEEDLLPLLLDNIQDYALLLMNRQSIIVKWTPGVQRLFGYEENEIVGQTADVIFTPEDRAADEPDKERTRALENGRTDDIRWHLRKDGSRFWANGQLICLYDKNGQVHGFAKLVRDETARKHAEEALRESSELLHLTIESAQLGTCDWHYETGELLGNEQRFRLFGLDPQQGPMTAQQFRESIHPDDRESIWAHLTRQIEDQGEHHEEYRVVWPDGAVRWIAEAGRVVQKSGGKPLRVLSVLWDVTTRREVEVGRAELVKRIVNTQEAERARISHELHDNLGQHLTGVMLGLKALENQIAALTGGKRQQVAPQLDVLRMLVDDLMKAAHRQAWELRPAELDAMGVEVALRHYAKDWSQMTGVEVDFQAVGWEERRPEEAVETTLYRVVQEALTNVARHAKATRVGIVLELSHRSVSAIVEDNGCGFALEKTGKRLGVLGMQERLAIVGGTLDIESSAGAGTTVFARVPLQGPLRTIRDDSIQDEP